MLVIIYKMLSNIRFLFSLFFFFLIVYILVVIFCLTEINHLIVRHKYFFVYNYLIKWDLDVIFFFNFDLFLIHETHTYVIDKLMCSLPNIKCVNSHGAF